MQMFPESKVSLYMALDSEPHSSKHMWITNLNLPLRGRCVPLPANSVY